MEILRKRQAKVLDFLDFDSVAGPVESAFSIGEANDGQVLSRGVALHARAFHRSHFGPVFEKSIELLRKRKTKVLDFVNFAPFDRPRESFCFIGKANI